MRNQSIAIALSFAVICAACSSEPAEKSASAAQQQAMRGLLDALRKPDGLKTRDDAMGLAGKLFGAGAVFNPAVPGGVAGRTQGVGESCVTESGPTITYACPNVTGTVTQTGDDFQIDLKLVGVGFGGPGGGNMIFSGRMTQTDGYSTGSLYMEMETPSGTMSQTYDYEVFRPSSHGWVTMTWQGGGETYKMIRVTFDGDTYWYDEE